MLQTKFYELQFGRICKRREVTENIINDDCIDFIIDSINCLNFEKDELQELMN